MSQSPQSKAQDLFKDLTLTELTEQIIYHETQRISSAETTREFHETMLDLAKIEVKRRMGPNAHIKFKYCYNA